MGHGKGTKQMKRCNNFSSRLHARICPSRIHGDYGDNDVDDDDDDDDNNNNNNISINTFKAIIKKREKIN
jgi:hypothetical protein